MSVPREHHFLPQFYTARWASSGSMVRHVRPRPNASVHVKEVAPKAIGKMRDLYAYSAAATEEERQRLEIKLFAPIDNIAAGALQKIENNQSGTSVDKVGLIQFLLSLQWRSPSRIAFARNEIINRMTDVKDFDASDPINKAIVADSVNDLLIELISSKAVISLVAKMKIFRIDVSSRHKLLTSDLPLMMSQGVAQPQGFLMFPFSPDCIVIFAHDAKVAAAFSTQEPDTLTKGLNDAVVRQAKEFVIAADFQSKRFVENRFLKNPDPISGDGLMRWQVP